MYEAITIPNEEIAAETASVVPSSSKRAEAASSARPGVIDEHLRRIGRGGRIQVAEVLERARVPVAKDAFDLKECTRLRRVTRNL